jgi:hypothetical protein
MSSRVRSHEHGVLALVIAVLPWVALSRVGEWRDSSAPSLPRDHRVIESLTSRAIVTPDRVLFSVTGKRADGIRHIFTTPPNRIATFPLLLLGWEASPWVSIPLKEPHFNHPECRGPPLLASD